ncbi:MAG: Calx-beta domain-containing protein [Candidatus Diapherotrites archaeon]
MTSKIFSKVFLLTFIVFGFFVGLSFAIPVVKVVATDNNASESYYNIGVFKIVRDSNISSDFNRSLKVWFSLSGSAVLWQDYNISRVNYAIIPAGATSTYVYVYPIDDANYEPTENVDLNILPSQDFNSNPYYVGNPYSATVFIYDNDLPSVYLSVPDSNASEYGDVGIFRIHRNGYLGFPLSVDFNLSGSAINGFDYAYVGNTITIPSWSPFVDIKVKPIDDNVMEGVESVVLSLVKKPSYLLGFPKSGTIYIYD